MPDVSRDALRCLDFSAIILATLCGLFGIYFVLFLFAVLCTLRFRSVPSRRLRNVTISLFITLLIHFISRALQFARARNVDPPEDELYRWTIPLIVVGNVMTTLAGFLSDGLLVWRFYVIFDRNRWAKWIPGALVLINALLCWSADAQHLAIYHHKDLYERVLIDVTLKITVAWGWLMFCINTVLTALIIVRVLSVTRCGRETGGEDFRANVVVRAIVESASVTWIGLLLYEIASLAPTGGITTNLDVGYVLASVLPVFFGISQTLITIRLGFTSELSQPGSATPLPEDSSMSTVYNLSVPPIHQSYATDEAIAK